MKFHSLEPFVPSGADMQKAKALFAAIGFEMVWDAGDYAGFQNEGSKFILQNYNNTAFAENYMISVKIEDADAFYNHLIENKIPVTFGVRISKPADMPYGREVNLIDLAGVCWHFVQ